MLSKLVGAVAIAICTLASPPAMAQTPPASGPAEQALLPAAELEALVAPIALYSDSLLATVLMASTYPLEVVQADRWAAQHKNTPAEQLSASAAKQPWDESVKALVATPSVLSMMSVKLEWTQKLGDAVLAQQSDVMDAVQRLRRRAQGNGKLTSGKEQSVRVETRDDNDVVVIEQTDPNTVYVPYYEPAAVYGDWPYPEYPAYAFPDPGYFAPGVLATGVAFGAAYAVGRWAWRGNYWGGGVNWRGGNIVANRPVNINNVGNNWQHNPAHRGGVRYGNATVQQKFGGQNRRNANQARGGAAPKGQRAASSGTPKRSVGKPAGSPKAAAKQRPAQKRAASSTPRNTGARRAGASPRAAPHARHTRNAGSPRAANRSMGPGRAAGLHGGMRGGGARGGFGGGRGGFGGGRGGGRRSDAALKHDIVLLGRLANGLGIYRFAYNGARRLYVGVLAQEVREVIPQAVIRGADGYLRVDYRQLGMTFQTYEKWISHLRRQ
jgi:hypothetical protein